MIVVDDGSDPPLATLPGWRTIVLPNNRGPGAARNAGLAEGHPLVAFVDTDVDLDDGWLEPLLATRRSSRARRPRSVRPGESVLMYRAARFRSTSAAGGAIRGHPSRLRAGRCVLMRTDTLRYRWFDEALRTGEDVDMVWRLIDATIAAGTSQSGNRPPSSTNNPVAVVRQHMAYGRSWLARPQAQAAWHLRAGAVGARRCGHSCWLGGRWRRLASPREQWSPYAENSTTSRRRNP
jgi:glycosyltransferase involved in cell wall biosynthesis